jgi:hypothetical protein
VPRVIVTTDSAEKDTPVMLDEQVRTVHVHNEHTSRQLLERLVWAVEDAERAEHATHAPA